jgi:four helix bundle protein
MKTPRSHPSVRSGEFGFEKLEVWQKAVDFHIRIGDFLEVLAEEKRHFRLMEQLEAASSSIAQNIAEGKGRFSKKELVQFCYYARGSIYETVTLLVEFQKRGLLETAAFNVFYGEALELARMLKGFINSIHE